MYLTKDQKNVLSRAISALREARRPDTANLIEDTFPELNIWEDIFPIIQNVFNILKERKKTISTAESCTAGLLSYLLTYYPGSSDIFSQGWSLYSPDAKHSHFNLPKDISIYSKECALYLARESMIRAKTDIGVGITGYADTGEFWFSFVDKERNFTYYKNFEIRSPDPLVKRDTARNAMGLYLFKKLEHFVQDFVED